MKIYFIGQKGMPSRGGGIETYVEGLATHLTDRGHEVYAYTRPYYTSARKRTHNGVRLISLPTVETKHLDAIIHSFRAVLDVLNRDADIIYFQNIGPGFWAFLPRLFSQAKVVSILQSQDYEHAKWGWFARACLRLGERIMCLVSDEVIVVSRKMQEYVAEKYGRISYLVPNGMDPKRYVAPKEIKQWGLEKGNYIVSISRLVRHKNIHTLIMAYQKLRTSKKLVIVGDGSYTDDYVAELKALAGNNKNIIFTGNQTGRTLEELYANAYVFVQPSSSEGMSLALLEAMSYKRPILVSDIPENLEVADGVAAVFRTGNTDDLADKLSKMIKRPALLKEMGEEARARMMKRYEWQSVSRQIEKLFRFAMMADSQPAPEPILRIKMARRFISFIL